MKFDLEAAMEGFSNFQEKLGSNFDQANGHMLPTITSQAKWRFARSGNTLHLSDGNVVHSFKAPAGISHTEEFALKRLPNVEQADYLKDAESSGLAQVHRADPGSIYFTMQDGQTNPTLSIRHTGGDDWRGSPKVKKVKKTLDAGAMQIGFAEKTADLNRSLGDTLQNGINRAKDIAMLPNNSTDGNSPYWAAGLGALGGAAYHFGKTHLYNTPEENQDDDTGANLLKRMAIPAAGLGLLGLTERSMFGPGGGKGQLIPGGS